MWTSTVRSRTSAWSLAVDGVEQLVAGQDPAVRLEERLEEAELDAGQGDRLAVAGDLVAVEVDDQVGVAERRRGRPRRGLGRGRAVRRRIDLTRRTSSAGRERLGQVVVGAVLEAGDPVERRAAGRQDRGSAWRPPRRRGGRPG